MAVDYAKINGELTAVLGHKVVELRPSREYSFVLHFFSNYPTARQILIAKRLVERHQKTIWSKPQRAREETAVAKTIKITAGEARRRSCPEMAGRRCKIIRELESHDTSRAWLVEWPDKKGSTVIVRKRQNWLSRLLGGVNDD